MRVLVTWCWRSSGRCSLEVPRLRYSASRVVCPLLAIGFLFVLIFAALVEPSAKIHLPDLRAGRLLFPSWSWSPPRRSLCLLRFSAYISASWSTAPPFLWLG